jgi:hypothetical protein
MMMASFALDRGEFFTLNSSLWIRFCSFCNIQKYLLNELVLPFSNSTWQTFDIFGIVFGCCFGIFQNKPFFNYFYVFSNRVLTSPKLIASSYWFEIWKPQECFLWQRPTNGIGFDVYSHIPILVDAAALT